MLLYNLQLFVGRADVIVVYLCHPSNFDKQVTAGTTASSSGSPTIESWRYGMQMCRDVHLLENLET